MSFLKKFSPFIMCFILFAGTAYAQNQEAQPEKVTDQELENFVSSTQDAQAIQLELQQKIQGLLQDEGMEFQRFQTIMQSKQNPKLADSIKVTKEEEQAIAKVQPKMQEANKKAQGKFVAAIEDNDLTQQRFQQILQAVQSNPEVAQRFQKMNAEKAKSEEDGK